MNLNSRYKIPVCRFEKDCSDYAGHTWATLAFYLDISGHVIAMGLSHETGKANSNHFYINNGNRKLDQANRMVIDYVEGKIELD